MFQKIALGRDRTCDIQMTKLAFLTVWRSNQLSYKSMTAVLRLAWVEGKRVSLLSMSFDLITSRLLNGCSTN